jgi:hypothetical protein
MHDSMRAGRRGWSSREVFSHPNECLLSIREELVPLLQGRAMV